jgi:lipoate-protein ligase B
MTPRSPIAWSHLGRVPYRRAVQLQHAVWSAIVDRTGPERILTLEHDPVITLGRRTRPEHLTAGRDRLQRQGIDIVEVDRGGEATYHGPGQLVVYALVHCRDRALGPSDIVHTLADAIADELHALGVPATWDKSHPGLWVNDAKIAAVGMRIASGVSRHGASLNVTADLSAYQLFVPCGIPDRPVTRLADHVTPAPALLPLAERIVARIGSRLDSPIVETPPAWTDAIPSEDTEP